MPFSYNTSPYDKAGSALKANGEQVLINRLPYIMILEKILFLYPTLVREGMVLSGRHFPDTVLYDVNPLKTYPILISIGFITSSHKTYYYEIDVRHNDESVIDSQHNGESNYRILATASPSPAQVVTSAAFFLKAIKMQTPGLYTATVSMREVLGSDENCTPQLIDTKECFFIVAGD